MNHAWRLIGRAAFWLAWPLLYVYFYSSRRTRVLVVAGDEVLLVKPWLASGRWSLPGGGLHRHEDPRAGAVRELYEETGIEVAQGDLRELSASRVINQDGHTFFEYAFLVVLPDKLLAAGRNLEITDIIWADWQKLATATDTDKDLRRILAVWQGKG